MSSWTQTIDRYIFEGRTVSGGKVDETAKNAEASQASFTQTLQSAFKQQFGAQTALTQALTTKLTGILNNPTGLDQATEAALNTQAVTQSATDTQNAIKASQAQAAAHGGPTALPSGVQEQIAGQINAAGASEKSAALTSIQQQDAQLKQQNQWDAVQGLEGVAGIENPNAFGGTANSGSGAVAGLSGAVSNSQQTGFWNTLGNTFASGLGKGLATGGGPFGI